MKPKDAYRLFKSLTLHAQGRFEYSPGYMVHAPKSIPENMNHIYQHFCNRFKEERFYSYVVSAIIADNTLNSIGSLYSEEPFFDRNYDQYEKRRCRTPYYFNKDLDKIFYELQDKSYKISDWMYGGGVLRWYMQGKLHIDTFTLLNMVSNFLEKGEQNFLFAKMHLTFCRQYAKICEITKRDREECKELVFKKIKEIREKSQKI